MKKPSTSIKLRHNTDKTFIYVNVAYTYDRQKHYFPLGMKLELKYWDSKSERVNFRYADSPELNARINKALSTINNIANQLILDNVEPTIEVVKAKYFQCLEGDRWWKETNEKAKPLNIARAQEHRTRIEELEEEIKILKWRERKNLRWAGVFENPNPYVEQSSQPLMLEMLEEYVLQKTKAPLKDKKKKTTGTTRQIRAWANTFISFTKSKEALHAKLAFDLTGLDQKFYDTYAAYLMNPKGHNLYNNTFGGHVKKLKTFLKWCEIDKQLDVDRRYVRFKVLSEEKEIICLTKTDIDLLSQYQPKPRTHADAIDHQKYVDFTIFSFFTGLRISDVKKSEGLRIINGYLQGKTTKTRNQFKIPLNIDERVSQILEKYDYNMQLFSDVEYNKRIKVILKDFLEEHDLYQQPISITRYKLREAITSVHNFADLYTSHCNRRGFVSFAYDLGFEVRDIMELIGTKSEKEILKYLKLKTDHLSSKLERLKNFKQ